MSKISISYNAYKQFEKATKISRNVGYIRFVLGIIVFVFALAGLASLGENSLIHNIFFCLIFIALSISLFHVVHYFENQAIIKSMIEELELEPKQKEKLRMIVGKKRGKRQFPNVTAALMIAGAFMRVQQDYQWKNITFDEYVTQTSKLILKYGLDD